MVSNFTSSAYDVGKREEEDTNYWFQEDLESCIAKLDPINDAHKLDILRREHSLIPSVSSFNSKCSRDGFIPLLVAEDPFWRTNHLLDEYSGELYDSDCDSNFSSNFFDSDFDWDFFMEHGPNNLYSDSNSDSESDRDTVNWTQRYCCNGLNSEESDLESKEEENIEQLESKEKEDVPESESKEEEYIEDSETKKEEDTKGELGLLVEEAKKMISGLKELIKDGSSNKVVASPMKEEKIVKVSSGDEKDDAVNMEIHKPTIKIEVELVVSSKDVPTEVLSDQNSTFPREVIELIIVIMCTVINFVFGIWRLYTEM